MSGVCTILKQKTQLWKKCEIPLEIKLLQEKCLEVLLALCTGVIVLTLLDPTYLFEALQISEKKFDNKDSF